MLQKCVIGTMPSCAVAYCSQGTLFSPITSLVKTVFRQCCIHITSHACKFLGKKGISIFCRVYGWVRGCMPCPNGNENCAALALLTLVRCACFRMMRDGWADNMRAREYQGGVNVSNMTKGEGVMLKRAYMPHKSRISIPNRNYRC